MSWIDWCIVIIPMGMLIGLAIYSGKFARGVVDFLAAGRIAGRYVLCIGELTSALSVISLVAGCEQNYQTGYAVGFWGAITAPVGTLFALSGYPFLERMGWVEGLNNFLVAVSSSFNPWIKWSMDPVKYPINSFEIYFISMMLSLIGYIGGSYLTYKPYNLDKLLHRGKYADGPEPPKEKWTFRNMFSKLIGITPEYTRGDRFIAYLVFGYSIVYSIMIIFLGVVIWNSFSPWPSHWWTVNFLITSLIVPGIVGVVSTIWFLIGGIRDIRQLFIDLADRVEDPNDNGQVFHEKE